VAELTALIHGESGVGKSWLGDTAPAPRLVLDIEGRARYTPSQPKVMWDLTGPPPVADGTWDTCFVPATEFQQADMVFQWLRSGQHQFKSYVVDSFTELQKRLIDQIAGMAQLKTQDWGEILRRLESFVRTHSDLALLTPSNPLDCVIMTAGTTPPDEGGMRRPLVQGQLKLNLPYFFDVVGYLYVTQAPEDGTLIRNLLVQPHPNIVAKDGTGRLGQPVIQDPNLAVMFNQLNGGSAQ